MSISGRVHLQSGFVVALAILLLCCSVVLTENGRRDIAGEKSSSNSNPVTAVETSVGSLNRHSPKTVISKTSSKTAPHKPPVQFGNSEKEQTKQSRRARKPGAIAAPPAMRPVHPPSSRSAPR